jgi:cell division protein YceG involved in septum cleavage
MSTKSKKESIWIKIYLIFLFLCGIAIWFIIQHANEPKISVDINLDKKVVDILMSHNIKQENIVEQFARERNINTDHWIEFYKVIKLKQSSKIKDFEKSFRILARSMKVGLSKTNHNGTSITYKFYSPDKTYLNITFLQNKGDSK